MTQILDYSYARPDPARIAGDGYTGVIRYLCPPGDSKRITPGELAALHGAGLAVGLVWETTATRAAEGFDAGTLDAGRADNYADELGWPGDRPLYFAVDFQAHPDQIAGYTAGIAARARRPWGLYGHYDIVEAYATRTAWLWQCAAWSGNGGGTAGSIEGRRLSAHARLFQRVAQVYSGGADVNDVLATDWGGWHPDHHQEEPDVLTDDDKALLGQWMQEQSTNVITAVDHRLDALAWGVVAGNIKVIEAVNNAVATGQPVDLDQLRTSVSAAVVDELARRLQPDPAQAPEGGADHATT